MQLQIHISLKKNYLYLSEKILAENPGLTREQLNLKNIDNLIKQYDDGKVTEFDEYKESFKNLIFGLAKTDEERLQLQQEINAIPKWNG
jgi:hypothetical protein